MTNIEKAFRRCAAAVSLNPKEILQHILRHTVITHPAQAGIDLPTVKRISIIKNYKWLNVNIFNRIINKFNFFNICNASYFTFLIKQRSNLFAMPLIIFSQLTQAY